MLRTVAGVIVGYIVMALCVVVALSVGFTLLGEDWAFQEGSYRTSTQWAVLMLGVGFIAACVGGLVCRLVAGQRGRAVLSLAIVVLILGGLDAAMRLAPQEPSDAELVRSESTPVFEAAGKAKPPIWVGFANPIVGVAGVLVGGSMIGRRRGTPSAGE